MYGTTTKRHETCIQDSRKPKGLPGKVDACSCHATQIWRMFSLDMIIMAVKGLTAKQKAALAEIVTSETLLDIEEYIRPQFPPKLSSKEPLISEKNFSLPNVRSRRRIVQDGHGRWREVKTPIYSSNLQSCLRKTSGSDKRQNRLESEDGGSVKTVDNRHTNYNNLSMALRSNVFPGVGNNQWHSTTANVFTEQEIIPTPQRGTFFGIQTDEFAQWSAANVHHERMKKTWDTYLDTLPKQAGNYYIYQMVDK